MKTVNLVLAIFALLYLVKCNNDHKREIRKLNTQISDLKAERPELWHQSCLRAVNGTCFWGDCAVIPIEIIQEKVCKPLEEE